MCPYPMYKQPLAELGRFTGTPSHHLLSAAPNPTSNNTLKKKKESHAKLNQSEKSKKIQKEAQLIEINPKAASEKS